MERYDVCVVGGGAAGLCAAYEASKAGASVCIISKGCLGLASATAMSAGIFTHPTEGLREDELRKATIDIGCRINDGALVQRLVSEGSGIPYFLKEVGIEFDPKPSGIHLRRKRLRFPGVEFGKRMRDLLKERGVVVHEHCSTESLIMRGDRCVGAVSRDKGGSTFSIISDAVILATGGFCGIFETNDNPAACTGDGIAMALRAGAAVRDAEFVQFFPIGMAEENLPPFVLFPPYPDEARLVNDKGEDVLRKRLPEERNLTRAVILQRDKVCQAIAFEEERGRNCYLDLSEVNDWKGVDMGTMNSMYQLVTYGHMPANGRIRITTTAHHSMGGVVIDENARTGVKGLYAAGEIAGGLHGANRRGGNALAEAVVFGRIAGEAAAGVRVGMVERRAINNMKEAVEVETGDGSGAKEARRRIAAACSRSLGIVRSRGSLAEGISEIREIEKGIGNEGKVRSFEGDEVKNMALIAQIAMQSALLRQESRGSHFRKDFPVEDDRWLGSIRASLSGAQLAYSFVPNKLS